MNAFRSHRLSGIRWMLALTFLILPQIVLAQWQATVGAQRNAMGNQALAFLPNEIWIHAGDSITWTFNVDEIHTVSFLTAARFASLSRWDVPASRPAERPPSTGRPV